MSRVIFLTLLSSLVLFSFLGRIALVDPDEPRYAESAREMIVLKDYVIPHLNFQPRINKPPLFYWLILVSYKIFGVNEFSARFPSAFLGLMLILGMYFFLRKEMGEKKAYLSSLILLSAPAFFITSRIAITDMVYTSLIIFSLFLFWGSSSNRKLLFLGQFFLGLALVTKGPAGLLLIFLTLLIFSFWQRERILITNFLNPGGVIILLLVGGLWYLLLISRIGWTGFKDLFFQETWGRIGEGFVHAQPFYYYLPLTLGAFLPWSLFFISMKKNYFQDKFSKFLSTFVLVTLFFFSLCKTKLPTYILPIFPALSILVASIIDRYWNLKYQSTMIIFLIFLASPFVMLFLFPQFSIVLDKASLYKIGFFVFLFTLPGLFLFKVKLKYQFWYLFFVPFLIYFYLLVNFGDGFSLYRSSKALFVQQEISSDVIYTWKLFKPSIVFYSRKRLKEVNDISHLQSAYLVIKKEDFSSIQNKVKSLKLLSQTKRLQLLQVQKLQN